jgi:type IV pilus assembly protein PilW
MQVIQQRGVSLVEMMVAATLSIVIGAGVIQIFSSNKNTYRVQEAVARLQENGRFAMDFLTKDMRMAGFFGCSGMSSGLTINNNVGYNKNHGTAANYDSQVDAALAGFTGTGSIQGFSYTSGTPQAALSAVGLTAGNSFSNLVANTDVLFIKRGSSCPGGNVTDHDNINNNTANLKIADNSACLIQKNDIVMVSNCQTADIFGVSDTPLTTPGSVSNITHGGNWNVSPKLPNTYSTDARLFKLRNDVYYIGVGSSGQPALFRRDLSNLATTGGFTSVELVEGIDDLTLLYGLDTDTAADGVADKYITAAGITTLAEWDRVVSIRVQLSARTIEDNVAANTDGTWNDKRIRRTFTATTAIRNRTAG